MANIFFVSDFLSEKSHRSEPDIYEPSPKTDKVKSEEVRLRILENKLKSEIDPVKKQHIENELKQVLKVG